MLKKGNKHLYPYEKCKQSQFQRSIITLVQTAGAIPTLYFVKIVVLLLGEQMRVSVFPGVDLPDKQRLEPAVFTERHKAPVATRRERQRRNKRLDTISPRFLTMCTSISLSSPITPISLLHAEQIESAFFDCVYFRRRAPPHPCPPPLHLVISNQDSLHRKFSLGGFTTKRAVRFVNST